MNLLKFYPQHGGVITSGGDGGADVSSPVLGHRVDSVVIDDMQPSPMLRGASIAAIVQNVAEYNKRLADQFGYIQEVLDSASQKENKVSDIGGTKCHLCGNGLLNDISDNLHTKKRVTHKNTLTYMCGTSVSKTWHSPHLERVGGLSGTIKNRVTVGEACIDIGGVK